MRTVGLSLGLALLCLLRAEAEDLGAVGLDKSKIAGKWHIIALASDSESYLRKKDELKMATATITVLGEGDLKVSFAVPTPKGCKKSERIYKQTGVPGEYYSPGELGAEDGAEALPIIPVWSSWLSWGGTSLRGWSPAAGQDWSMPGLVTLQRGEPPAPCPWEAALG
ncbi:extracellular fatty acid-binding protein-like isoform 2-T2 [Pluvialis apricaria]